MTVAAQNERERLHSGRDAMKRQLGEALEWETALAAHAEEFRDFVEHVRNSVRRNGEPAHLITQEMDTLLATPYQRNHLQNAT